MNYYIFLLFIASTSFSVLQGTELEKFNTPILFIIFKRPEHQKQVFEQIRQVRPTQLFIAADGPRANVPSDTEKCAEARKIIQQVDWPCEVKTLFRDKNLGCGLAVSSAITWFFSHVDEGIILKDDIKPSISFFYYCRKMLDYYRDDHRIFQINGNTAHITLEKGYKETTTPYFFNRFAQIWGWATWKRAWDHYDFNLNFLKKPGALNAMYRTIKQSLHPSNANMISGILNGRYYGGLDTWDIQWFCTILINGGWCISHKTNLTENIGFDQEATHTWSSHPNKQTSAQEIDWENLPKLTLQI